MKSSSPSINYVLWGATGQAKVLRETLRNMKLVAIFDNDPKVSNPFSDVPLYFGRKEFMDWHCSQNNEGPIGFLVAIGGDRGKDRFDIQKDLESFGLIPLIAIHPTAFVADNATIGSGSQILANATICVEAVIGHSCIVNTGVSVDHESKIGDGVHIGPGSHLAGLVEIGNFATLYTGTIVIPRIKIGEGAVVGAGAVVVEDVPPNTLVFGNPARIIRHNIRKEVIK